MNWSIVLPYLPLLGRGLLATIWLSLIGVLSGTVLGILVALARQSKLRVLSVTALVFVTVVRSIPLLLLLFLVYYLPPLMVGLDLSRFLVAWLSLSVYSAAYASEIIRSGLNAVPKLQVESGLAIGLTKMQVLRLVVLPQALKLMLPSYVGLYTVVLKDSSLVAVIGYIELARAVRIASDVTYEPFQFYLLALLFYFVLCYPLATLSRRLERSVHTE